MKKKTFSWVKSLTRALFSVALLALASGALMSCGDDDDDDGGKGGGGNDTEQGGSNGGNENNGGDFSVITKDKRLVNVGVISIKYDSKSRVVELIDNDKEETLFNIDYSNGRIAMNSNGNIANAVFDKNNYITSLYYTWVNVNNDEHETSSIVLDATYDNNGHIKLLKANKTSVNVIGGDTYNSKIYYNIDYTWTKGKLERIYLRTVENNNGTTYNWANDVTFDYGETRNKFKQYTNATVSMYDFPIYNGAALLMAGLFGKGTDYLPTKVTTIFTDDGGYSDEVSWNVTYSLKQDGRISLENLFGSEGKLFTPYRYADD